MFNIKRDKSENEQQYLWRLGQAKDNGLLDMSWAEIADLLNHEFREDEMDYRGESSYRKKYSNALDFFNSGVFKSNSDDSNESYIEELKEMKDTIYKEKRKLYDQRREYNKLLTSDARAEHLSFELLRAADRMNQEFPLDFYSNTVKKNPHKEALLCISDWHYGMVTHNNWNDYNTEICKQRVGTLLSYAKKYIWANGIDTLHVAMLGDFIHGAIHTSARIQSEEDTCDQIMNVSEILAEMVHELSSVTNHVYVYSCYGNHARTIQKKEDSIHSDNMEKIIPWWMKQRLKDNKKVEIFETEYKEFYLLNILGYNVCILHGDLEKEFKNIGVNINTLFNKRFGVTVDYTVSGDKHHLEEFEQFGIESILVRSLCGTDDYANNKRLYSRPGQTLMIFNDVYGREATYNIPLDIE